MQFKIWSIFSVVAVLTGGTIASDVTDTPTPTRLEERAHKESVAPGCWTGTNFPPKAAWSPFPVSYKVAEGAMYNYANDTKREVENIRDSIKKVAKKSGFDELFILAIMRRESDGNTIIKCGDMGRSCGLMQVHGQNVPHCKHHPCPKKDIYRMIKCGVEGCGPKAASIAECASRYGKKNYAALARCYNSGSVPDPSDYSKTGGYGVATYVQDVGNLLLASDYTTWSSFDNEQCGF